MQDESSSPGNPAPLSIPISLDARRFTRNRPIGLANGSLLGQALVDTLRLQGRCVELPEYRDTLFQRNPESSAISSLLDLADIPPEQHPPSIQDAVRLLWARLQARKNKLERLPKKMREQLKRTDGMPVVVSWGTARNRCVLPETRETYRRFAQLVAPQGLCAVHGGGPGSMGAFQEEFGGVLTSLGVNEPRIFVAALNWVPGQNHEPLITTHLDLTEIVPLLRLIEMRTLALLTIACPELILINEGGMGTFYELFTLLIHRQMRNWITTSFSPKERQVLTPAALMETRRECGWFYDGFRLQLLAAVEAGTVNPQDVDGLHFLRFGPPGPSVFTPELEHQLPGTVVYVTPEEAAHYCADLAWSTHAARKVAEANSIGN